MCMRRCCRVDELFEGRNLLLEELKDADPAAARGGDVLRSMLIPPLGVLDT